MLDDYAARVSEGVVWVIEEGSTLAGIIVLLPRPDHLLLDNIAVVPAHQGLGLAGCGKSRHFGKTVMKRARAGNSVLIKSICYEGAKGDELGWKHHRPTFSAAC